MIFSKETLRNIIYDDAEGFELIEDTIHDTSRWSVHHSMVFKHKDKYYMSSYSVGATEQQDELPYEYDDNEIECDEVKPVETTIIKYVKV